MRNKILFITILMLAACAPSPEVIQTAVAQTQVALPTSTIVPTATISATATPDYEAYLGALRDYMLAYTSAYTDFQTVFLEANEDNSLLLDANWKSRMDNAMDSLIDAAAQLESVTPVPPVFETLNGHLKQISSETRLLVLSLKLFLSGDTSQVDAFLEHTDKLSEYLDLASAEADKFLP